MKPMQHDNQTLPGNLEAIPLIFFETIKNISHSDGFLSPWGIESFTSFPEGPNAVQVSAHDAGLNHPSFVGAKETIQSLHHNLKEILQECGVDYAG